MGLFDPVKDILNEPQGTPPQPGPKPNPNAVDPSVFGDPVALKTDWTPAKGGGANFRTTRLVERSPSRLEFRPSALATVFALVFVFSSVMSVGLVVFAWPFLDPLQRIGLVGGLILFETGILALLVYMRRPTVFDRSVGWFWKSWTAPQPGRT